MTTDNHHELRSLLREAARVRRLLDKGLHQSSMTHIERLAWRTEVESILKGIGVTLAPESHR